MSSLFEPQYVVNRTSLGRRPSTLTVPEVVVGVNLGSCPPSSSDGGKSGERQRTTWPHEAINRTLPASSSVVHFKYSGGEGGRGEGHRLQPAGCWVRLRLLGSGACPLEEPPSSVLVLVPVLVLVLVLVLASDCKNCIE